MESRTRLAISGVATVAASVAVVCAVAMSTSVALADTAGASADARPVVVPASSASPTPVASAPTAPTALQASAPVDEPETVPAPEPEDVAAPSPKDAATAPSPVAEPSSATEDHLVAEVAASGSWDSVYAWAATHGWPTARTEAWVARLDAKLAEKRADDDAGRSNDQDSTSGNRVAPPLPAETDDTSERDLSGSSFGSMREQSRVPPD